METHVVQVGELVISQFPVFGTNGSSFVTGIPPEAFEIFQFQDTSEVSVTVTVSEIGSTGVYQVSFTPTSQAQWLILLRLSLTGDVWGIQVKAYSSGARGVSEAQLNTAYDEDSGVAFFEAWLDRNGQTIQAPNLVSCSLAIYDYQGSLIWSGSSVTPKADGHFSLSDFMSFSENRPYNVVVVIVDSIGSVTTCQAFTTVG